MQCAPRSFLCRVTLLEQPLYIVLVSGPVRAVRQESKKRCLLLNATIEVAARMLEFRFVRPTSFTGCKAPHHRSGHLWALEVTSLRLLHVPYFACQSVISIRTLLFPFLSFIDGPSYLCSGCPPPDVYTHGSQSPVKVTLY
jgi:hypothetical protein